MLFFAYTVYYYLRTILMYNTRPDSDVIITPVPRPSWLFHHLVYSLLVRLRPLQVAAAEDSPPAPADVSSKPRKQ